MILTSKPTNTKEIKKRPSEKLAVHLKIVIGEEVSRKLTYKLVGDVFTERGVTYW